jgi:hypothetical protein
VLPDIVGRGGRWLRVAFYLTRVVLVEVGAENGSGCVVGGAEAEGGGGAVGALLDDGLVGLEPLG